MAMGGFNQGGGMTCPGCGAQIEPGETFCYMCGMNLSAFGAGASGGMGAPAGDFCPHCGSTLQPGDVFCVTCGSPLGDANSLGGASATGVMTPDIFSYGGGAGQAYGGAVQPPAGNSGYMPAQPPASSGSSVQQDGDMADDDDPTVRPQLLMLTYQEARMGCRKTVSVDGQPVEVSIPAGVNVTTKLDIPGYGYYDELTGERGPLRLTFFLV